jgi:L-asparaginase II
VVANPVLVELWRGGEVESFHRGAVAVVDASGTAVATVGDVDRPVFPRSAVKALQALPLVESGAADRLQLSSEQLALACASHGGEERHVRTAASVLELAGLDASVLECGSHWPGNEAASRALARDGRVPTALHNNCSGKHAGFVCVGCLMSGGRDAREFLRGYVQAEHPLMREISAALEAATGCRLADAPHGTDGCSIPTFGIPLSALALGFARFGTGTGLSEGRARAARRLREAVAAAPFLVAGTGRFDTRVMERLGRRVFCKVGAEGVYCAAFPELGIGVALKIDDGNNARAAEVAMAALIERFVTLDDGEAAFMRELSDVALTNWNGIEVGRLSAADSLRRTHAPSPSRGRGPG